MNFYAFPSIFGYWLARCNNVLKFVLLLVVVSKFYTTTKYVTHATHGILFKW